MPTEAGIYWVRLHGKEGWCAIARVIGEAPFLRVSRVIELDSISERSYEFDIAEWGPGIDRPEYHPAHEGERDE